MGAVGSSGPTGTLSPMHTMRAIAATVGDDARPTRASSQSEIDDPATYGWTLTIGQLTFAAGPKFGAASAVVRSCTVENALLFHGTTLHSGV